jgi:hypothetical protein
MLAEYAVLSEEALVHVPSHLSFEEAATLPCAAVTAWVALTGHRKVTAGDTVLTQGSGPIRGPWPFRQGRDLARLIVGGRGSIASDVSDLGDSRGRRQLMQVRD